MQSRGYQGRRPVFKNSTLSGLLFDEKPVDAAIALLVPDGAGTTHIKLLSRSVLLDEMSLSSCLWF